ncbi:MAG: SsrA-binding protein SmpB [Rhodothermales bacterium]
MSDGIKIVTSNRKAFYEFHIEERLEAGVALVGTEVKSLRDGKANLQDAYCAVDDGEMFLYNLHIKQYDFGNRNNHEPTRKRKLLLHKKEISKWRKAAAEKGYTIVPLKIYFKQGFAKVEIGLAKGKKLHDKRQSIAERETKRRLDRVQRGGSYD